MPSDDYDESTDPLTAPLWPVSEAAEILKFDPANEERPESSTPMIAVPKPPDVDAILRGEYTGWVPVIKAGESLVDAQERAAAKIRRIEAEIDAADLDGAHSVSMWIPFNSGAVPLPPQVTNVPPAPKAPPTRVIPARPMGSVPTGEFTRMIPDPDQVLSPADALDEARRRIRQMREDLESNVQMVTRSFEHEFFAVPEDDSTPEAEAAVEHVVAGIDPNEPISQVSADADLDSDAPVYVEAQPLDEPWQPTATAVVRLQRRTMEEIADEIEAAIDANDARIGEHVVNAHKLRERLAQQRDEVARKVAAMSSATLSRDVLEAMKLETSVESVNGVPVIGQQADDDPSLEPLNADRPARVTLDDGLVASPAQADVDRDDMYEATVRVDEPMDFVVMPSEALQIGDIASDVDEEIEDAVIVESAASTPIPSLAPDWTVDTPAVSPGTIGGDSEAKFLGDLLDSLADVEAAVTAVVNSTALDDVLAKYKDILEADTSSATAADLETAAQVEAMVAETRVDIDAMIRGLKAAAETFSDADAGQGVAEAASVLEGILTAGPGDAVIDVETTHASLVESSTALDYSDPLAAVTDEVARMRAAALAAIGVNEELEPLPASSKSVAEPEVLGASVGEPPIDEHAPYEAPLEPVLDAPGAAEIDEDDVLIEDEVGFVPLADAEVDTVVEPAQAQVPEVVDEPLAPSDSVSAAEPDLVSLVDSALKPISLPPIFRGEPKRMSPQDQLDALGGTVPNMTPPRPRQKPMPPRKPAVTPESPAPPMTATPVSEPSVGEDLVPGGRRANTAEEFEIDQIIAAAARPPAPASFWDDDEGDSVLDASAVMGRSAPRAERPVAAAPAPGETIPQDSSPKFEPLDVAESPSAPIPPADAANILQDIQSSDAVAEPRTDAVSRRIADESIFKAAANSPTAATYVLNEQASRDHSLELVIMRDEIRDLRDRLDSSQRLIEDLMVRLAQLTEIALKQRSN